MLKPKKSLLAVFGLTRHTENLRRITDLVPCQNCSLAGCQYRRVPYGKALLRTEVAQPESTGESPTDQPVEEVPSAPGLDLNAKYEVNAKALRRWADERLTLDFRDDGTIDATFRYEGTTCRNMGRTMRFVYTVKLGPRAEGYVIRESLCAPAAGDDGHTYMCRYMSNAEHLKVAIDHEKPLLGRPLNEVLSWQRAKGVTAGCYCEPSSRKHKWGLALETIHFALAERDKGLAAEPSATMPLAQAAGK
jgi:hypothetical protein